MQKRLGQIFTYIYWSGDMCIDKALMVLDVFCFGVFFLPPPPPPNKKRRAPDPSIFLMHCPPPEKKQHAHYGVAYRACTIPPLRHFFGWGVVTDFNWGDSPFMGYSPPPSPPCWAALQLSSPGSNNTVIGINSFSGMSHHWSLRQVCYHCKCKGRKLVDDLCIAELGRVISSSNRHFLWQTRSFNCRAGRKLLFLSGKG